MCERIFFQIRKWKSINSDGYKLENVNLDLKRGEVFALVGNSEYDINAFMEAIYGAVEPIEGEIIFKDKIIHSIKKNIGISFLYRNSYLFEYMSVSENIALPKFKRTWFVNGLKIKLMAKEILKELNFHIDHQEIVCNLSIEQKKLVSIARAFNNKPEIVIMNNPMEALSSKSVQNLYEVIHRFKVNNGSIIYLTQHWEEALKVADRISVLAEGQNEKVFLTEDVRRNPQQLLDCLGYYNYKKNILDIEPKAKEILDSVLKAAEFITSEHELKDVLTLLSEQVVKFMNADGCIIHLIDEETKTVIDKLELKTNDELHATLKDEVVIKIAEGENFFYSNMHEKYFTSNFSYIVNVKTVICIPLLVRTRVIGVMQIYYEKYYAHSEEQAKYLKTFAKHAGIAIEDTKLIGRSALLQESHHRIKNNLQSVINLISIQKQSIDDGQNEDLNNILDDIISRIKSIATVHDILSKDKKGRSVINLKEIIEV
ncbi:MAG: histidine kinase dimerization/phosphoacceptor domain -containing protein, partial [Ruminiclostridium sp.]